MFKLHLAQAVYAYLNHYCMWFGLIYFANTNGDLEMSTLSLSIKRNESRLIITIIGLGLDNESKQLIWLWK